MASQAASAGARSYYNIGKAAITGDTKGIDKEVKDMQEGKYGAPLQGYSLATEIVAEGAATGDWEGAVMKAGNIGKGTVAERVGSKLGDEAYQFIEKDLPEAYDFAKKDVGAAYDTAKSKWEGFKSWVRE
jgi:hypothetical protein